MFDLINLVLVFSFAFLPIFIFSYFYFKTKFYIKLETTEKQGIIQWLMIFFAHLGIFYIIVFIPAILTISLFNFFQMSMIHFNYLIGWLLGLLFGVIIPYKLKPLRK